MPLSAPANDFEQMFDLAPVSLWLEDYSGVKALFDGFQASGISDLQAHLRANPDLARQCAASMKVLQVNQRTLQVFAAKDQADLIEHLPEVFRDEMFDHVIIEMDQLWRGSTEFSGQNVNYALDGRRLDVLVRGRILPGHESTWDRVMVSLEDITERQQTLQQLARSELYARGLFEHSPVSLWVEDFSAVKRLLDEVRAIGVDDLRVFLNVHPEFVTRCMTEIRVIDVNQHTLDMFGAISKKMLLGSLDRVFRGEMRESFADQLLDLWQGKTTQMREVVNYSLTGAPIYIHMQFAVLEEHLARWDMVVVSLVDITARKKAESYLEYLGKHDVLTGLRNRVFFTEETNRLARKGPWPVALLMLDLNGLKHVNDEQGHAAGDALLRRAGEVLNKAVDAPGYAARIGGDEFAVLLPGLDEGGVLAMAQRIQSIVEVNNQFYPGNRLSFAIGHATCLSGEQLEGALHHADQAMYADKARYYKDHEIKRRSTDYQKH